MVDAFARMQCATKLRLSMTDTPDSTSDAHLWHSLAVDAVAQALEVDPDKGLRSSDAEARLQRYGANELATEPQTPAWRRFLAQFTDFIVLVLLAACVISGLLREWLDSIAILVIVMLNALVGFLQESRAKKAIDALQRMTSPQARAVRDGETQNVEARSLVPGDVILVEQGDIVPADARLVEAQNLQVEEAALTGESVPVSKDAAAVLPGETGLADRADMIFTSTRVTYGRGRAIVIATGGDTQLGEIAELMAGVVEERTHLQQRLDQLGRLLVYAALAVVALVFTIGVLQGRAMLEMFMVAVSLAVAAVPEGLAAVVTIALALGLQRLAKRRALVRSLPSVETLGATTVIASDKTGTLTQNRMTVRQIVVGSRMVDVEGDGYEPTGAFRAHGQPLDPAADEKLLEVLRIAAMASKAELRQDKGEWTVIGDPTEGALLVAAVKAGLTRDELGKTYEEIAEIPFDSDRKCMSVLVRDGQGTVLLFTKGAPDVLLARSTWIADGSDAQPLTDAVRARLEQANRTLAEQALRVLAVARRKLDAIPQDPTPALEADLTFVGLIGMLDPPRPEAIAAVAKAHQAGIRTVMITGDHAETAIAIARELGIYQQGDRAVTGAELQDMDDETLARDVETIRVYARVSPEHKLRVVRAWKSRDHIVAMTGDGVNDAPALKEADMGIAMGITGTDVSKEASDMVLADDNFATIVAAVEEGRTIFDNLRRFVLFLLSCNVGEVLTVFCGILLGLPLPLLPIQILWINLATDSLPALALGVESGEPGVMKRPPRPVHEPLITWHYAVHLLIQGAIIGAVALGAFCIEYFLRTPHHGERARVMAFSTSILAQLVHAFNLRSLRHSIFRVGLFTNRCLLWSAAAIVTMELGVIYLPFLQPVFKTMPLALVDWAWIVGLAIVPLVLVELLKACGLFGRDADDQTAADSLA